MSCQKQVLTAALGEHQAVSLTPGDAAGSPDPLSDCIVLSCCWLTRKLDASVNVSLLLPACASPVTTALGPLTALGLAGAASTGSPVTAFAHEILSLAGVEASNLQQLM